MTTERPMTAEQIAGALTQRYRPEGFPPITAAWVGERAKFHRMPCTVMGGRRSYFLTEVLDWFERNQRHGETARHLAKS